MLLQPFLTCARYVRRSSFRRRFNKGVTYLLIVTLLMQGWFAAPAIACPAGPNPKPNPQGNIPETPPKCPKPRGSSTPYVTSRPIILSSGSVIENVTDLSFAGPTFSWNQQRSYDSKVSIAATQLGRNWVSGEGDKRLVQTNPGTNNNVAFIDSASAKQTFTESGGTYTPPIGSDYVLTVNGTKLELLNSVSGELLIFHDFAQGNNSGLLYERTSREWKAAGAVGQVYTYDGSGRVTQITTADGQDERIAFTYVSASTWQLRRIQVGPLGAEFLEVEYTYKGDSTIRQFRDLDSRMARPFGNG